MPNKRRKKHVNIQTDVDVIGKDLLWARSWTVTTEDLSIQNHTRSGGLWADLQKRCLVGGTEQLKKPTYIGCENKFESFHKFSCWAQKQYGYLKRNSNGKLWSLDKDIIVPFNKSYSEETCAFVPDVVNSLLLFGNAYRGEYPLGVTEHSRQDSFVVKCAGEYIGCFSDEVKAHKAWQLAKIRSIKCCIQKYDFLPSRVIEGLWKHHNLILEDYESGRETIRI